METGDVRTQFQELQLQQQKKLMERMKAKNQDRSTSQVSDSFSFGLGDDLNLNTGDVSSSSIAGLHSALEDANTRMRDEIRELKDETGRLRKQMAEKDYEIKRLNKTINKMQDDKKLLANAGVVSDTAAVKIVDLSKRNRELTAEMEAERTKSMKLLKRIAELERNPTNPVDSPRKKTSPRNTLAVHPEVLSENVEELHDKLQSNGIKMAEYRNQIQELKQEMKVAHKVLQQEIGEPLQSMQLLLSSGGSGFRGRSQQILALQDKVRDLEQKLKGATGRGMATRPDKNLERIRNMEKQRKEQTDELRMEITKASDMNAELQRKIDATKARNRVLLNETKSLKSQITVLTEKGSHDNELIMTLMKQHENLQRIVEHNVSAKDNIEKAGVMFSKEMISRQQQEQAEIMRLRQLLAERDARLRELERNAQDLNTSKTVKGPGPVSYQPSATLEQPTEEDPNERKSETPEKMDQLQQSPLQDNRHLLQEIDDLRVELTKYRALYNSAILEHRKLSDIVNALTKRNEQSTEACMELNKNLSDEKRKSARLETALESAKPLKQDPSGIPTSQVSQDSKISELETLLSIQTDENAALKESLESTLRAKQEDVALFHDMMEQTKTVFMDALRSLSSKNQ